MNDAINPDHYRTGKVETIKLIEGSMPVEEYRGFLKGLIIKYICRFEKKNGVEDLKKAEQYLHRLIKLEEKK